MRQQIFDADNNSVIRSQIVSSVRPFVRVSVVLMMLMMLMHRGTQWSVLHHSDIHSDCIHYKNISMSIVCARLQIFGCGTTAVRDVYLVIPTMFVPTTHNITQKLATFTTNRVPNCMTQKECCLQCIDELGQCSVYVPHTHTLGRLSCQRIPPFSVISLSFSLSLFLVAGCHYNILAVTKRTTAEQQMLWFA